MNVKNGNIVLYKPRKEACVVHLKENNTATIISLRNGKKFTAEFLEMEKIEMMLGDFF